jgi:hypothetical protein
LHLRLGSRYSKPWCNGGGGGGGLKFKFSVLQDCAITPKIDLGG